MRRILLILGLSGTLGPAAADEPIEWKVAPRVMPGSGPRYQVDRVEAGGSVRLKAVGTFPDELRLMLGGVAEGYYLLIARDPRDTGPPQVLRVQVTDVAADGGFTLTTAPEAAGRLKPGDTADLARPAGSTTAQLRQLPAVIPLVGQEAGGDDPREAARQIQAQIKSVNNLKQIGLAMHNFHDANGSFPPAMIFGPDGKPWHSWRVLLLPYLEQADLYKQYDFAQPWDSERNRKVLERMPAVYRDPIYGDARGHDTHYAVLLGENTAFSPDGPEQKDPKDAPLGAGFSVRDFTDGTSNTILVVPVDPKTEIPWTKPEDVLVLPEFPGIGKAGGIAAPFRLQGRPDGARAAPMVFADGSVRTLKETIAAPVLSALMTRNGGEVIDPNAMAGGAGGNPPRTPVLTIRVEDGKATATLE